MSYTTETLFSQELSNEHSPVFTCLHTATQFSEFVRSHDFNTQHDASERGVESGGKRVSAGRNAGGLSEGQ